MFNAFEPSEIFKSGNRDPASGASSMLTRRTTGREAAVDVAAAWLVAAIILFGMVVLV